LEARYHTFWEWRKETIDPWDTCTHVASHPSEWPTCLGFYTFKNPGDGDGGGGWPPYVPPPTEYWVADTNNSVAQLQSPTPVGDNPIWRGEFVVEEGAAAGLSRYTGKFPTLQQALDSIPYLRIRISACAAGVDHIDFTPHVSGYQPVCYIGSVPVDTLSYIPDELTAGGEWFVIGTAPTASKALWTSTLGWLSDSSMQIADTQVTRASLKDCTLVLTKFWKINVERPHSGGLIQADSVAIHAYAPVHICGTGEGEVVITTGLQKTAPSNNLFYMTSTEMNYGLPVWITDLTLMTSSGADGDTSALILTGRVRLQNLQACVEGNAGGSLNDNAFLTYYANASDSKVNSILAENVTVVVDTLMSVYRLEGKRPMFNSQNSEYQFGGTDGSVLSCPADAGSANAPIQFDHDRFYVSSGQPSYQILLESGDTDSVLLSYCVLTDVMNNGILKVGNGAIYTGSTYIGLKNADLIPVELQRAQFPVQSALLKK